MMLPRSSRFSWRWDCGGAGGRQRPDTWQASLRGQRTRGQAVPAGVLAALDSAGTARSRRVALSIRQDAGTWDRIHADLAALGGQDLELAEAARTDLLAWLQHGAATSYGTPSPAQAAQIAGLLAAGKLSNRQRREIAFAAGIRMPAAES